MEKEINTETEQVSIEQTHYITKVFGWMAIGLTISGIIAYFTTNTPELMSTILSNNYGFWLLFGLQIGIIVFLTARIGSMTSNVAVGSFILYSIITGFVFSMLFLIFTMGGSIASTFFIIGGTFAVMTAIGYFTKTDLTGFSQIFLMAAVGLLIASAVNYLMDSERLYWISSYLGVLIFTGLIVFDTKKIKELNKIGNEGSDEDKKEAIMGALCLYIVF